MQTSGITEPLRVYWRQGCSSCVKVKEYLAGQGVDFVSIDIGVVPNAMDELRAMGVRTVPVVARGGEYVFAQALEEVSRFIGREFEANRLPPDVLIGHSNGPGTNRSGDTGMPASK